MVNTSFTVRWGTCTPGKCSQPTLQPRRKHDADGIRGGWQLGAIVIAAFCTTHQQLGTRTGQKTRRELGMHFIKLRLKYFLPNHRGVFNFHMRGTEFAKSKWSSQGICIILNFINKSWSCSKMRLYFIFTESEFQFPQFWNSFRTCHIFKMTKQPKV